jgi:signal transduction histidine kinase/DNA-binding response OmpR family regulator/ligand-binding sensor domain-containing protein
MKRLFLVLILFLVIFPAYCQYPEINYERLSVRQGLADNAIKCIMQDHAGFIWIGGNNGIYKYDGYDFTVITVPSGCRNCPSFKKVFSIREDNLGLLWLLSDIGITLYNPENGKAILIYQILWDSDHIQSDLSKCLLRDSQGNIWASGQSGLIKISYQKNFTETGSRDSIFNHSVKNLFRIESIQLSADKYGPDNRVLSVYEDEQENILVGCMEGIFMMKKGNKTFTRLDSHPKKGSGEVLIAVRDILQLNENSYWIISQNELCLLENVNSIFHDTIPDRSLLYFTRKKLKGGRPAISLSVDHQKNYLLATTDDLYKIKRDEKSGEIFIEPLFHDRTEKEDDIVNFKQIQSIFEDRSDVIWAAHSLFGISKFNLIQSQFTSYKNLIINNFTDDDIDLIYKDTPGNLWIGTFSGGFYKIQPGNKKVIQYDTGSLKNRIISMQEVSPGFFILGSNKGILEFNSESGKFSDPMPDTKIANNLRITGVADMLKDRDQIYIGTISGLFIYNILDKKLFQSTFNDNDSVIDYNNAILSLIKLKNGEILASSCYHGINKIEFDPRNGTISFIPLVTNKFLTENGIIDVEHHTLYEDSKGLLWIINYSGLHCINLKNLEVKSYKLFENIEFPQACSIIEDDHNNLWVGTHKGLCRFNTATERLRIFDKNNGLPVSIHGFNTVYKGEGGILYFGGLGGFYSFHPDSLKINDSIPPVVITDFRIFNKSILPGTATSDILKKYISYAHIVKLRHNQNELSFQFAALDYNQPSKNKYAYKLEGYQNNWILTNADNRFATYNKLKPGKYTFRVKGSNNDGVWNEKGASLMIIIQKPWWSTFYAWCIYVIVFSGSTGGLVYHRLWKLRREKLILENQVVVRTRQIEEQKKEILNQRDMLEVQNQKIIELNELKTRFFTNVSHEIRTPLTLIQSPVEELLYDPRRNETERRKLNLVQRNTQRLLKLVNQLLDISKLDVSKMKLEIIEADVIKYLVSVARSFASLAETKSIRYHLHFPKEELKTWFDPDKLEKIAVNLLSNAFKFTPAGGEVIFSASYSVSNDPKISKILVFSVMDTGMGIPDGKEEKVFDRFYQVESSLRRDGEGTGIGLSLAREMARLMHGDITIESKESHGSTFNVQIPLGKDHLIESEFNIVKDIPDSMDVEMKLSDSMNENVPEQTSKSTKDNPILLIVEDNLDIRRYLADNFYRDYVIYQAIEGVSGLKVAREVIPDLIITDLMMPGMDGVELCAKLKNDEVTCHIPIIMLTAKVTIEDKITGYETGADDYVPKPFNVVELKARVKNLVEQRKKLRERFSREITLEPSEISITPLDEKFLKKAIELVEKHINDEKFDLILFRNEMNMSRSTLFRKLQALTNQSPTEFIRTIRLRRAASLLKQNFGNVTQVSLEVGFNNLSYFNRSFKKLFGLSPIEYSKTV